MPEIVQILLFTICAGLCIPIGGVAASFENFLPQWMQKEFRHFIVAFGGGVLLAAVALVLVPEGNHYLDNSVWSVWIVIAGGVCFFALEYLLAKRNSSKPQLFAMLLDYIPECIALGGTLALGGDSGPLLAFFIGLQNLPEGFNTFRELRSNEQRESVIKILALMCLFVPLGPLVGVVGWLYFAENVELLGAIMLFASGGILYLIFQDIAPQSHMRRHWGPPLGAVLGFCLGMLGNNLMMSGS